MKRKLLLAALCVVGAIGGGNSLMAQTDVTSQYISNPGFEGESSAFLQLNSSRNIYKPIGWSVQWDQSGKGQNGNSTIGESWNQDSHTWSAKEGKSFFVRHAWEGNTFYLRQTMVNLRPGAYTLSFAMAANRANDNNTLTLNIADQNKDISPSTNGNDNGSWDEVSINFTITESTPNATIEFKASHTGNSSSNAYLKYGLDNFKLMYDGSSYYSTILEKAQALYNENKDWAEIGLTDFATAISTNSGKESVADKNAAIVALEEAMATYKAANSTDVTAKINNPNFDSNINGWTCTGGDGNNFQHQTSTQTNFTGGFLEKWRDAANGKNNQKNFDVSQIISNLPKGEYTIKAAILAQEQGSKSVYDANTSNYVNKHHGGPFYIDDEKGVWLYGTSGENSAKTWANSFNPTFGDTGGGVYRSTTVNVENGTLTIGFKGIGSENGGESKGTYANWIACDNWTLSYFGFDPTTLKAQITSLQTEATTLLSNMDYANVVGTEKTALETASTLVPADEKKSTLESAISQIETAIDAFTAAKTNYDALVAEIEKATALGMDASSYAATSSTTAATALTNTQSLKVAEYNYVTTTYQYGVELGTWTSSGTNTSAADFSNEHWSGETRTYKNQNDANGQGWNANSWSINFNQDVTLPAGNYVFKVAGRQASGDKVNTSLIVKKGETVLGEVSDFPRSNSSRGINKSGETAFEGENDDFANNGNGFGWEWRYVKFTLTEDATVNIAINSEATANHQWVSFGDYTVQTDNEANISLIAYNIALNDANTAKANSDYANVKGDELTELNAAIAQKMKEHNQKRMQQRPRER